MWSVCYTQDKKGRWRGISKVLRFGCGATMANIINKAGRIEIERMKY